MDPDTRAALIQRVPKAVKRTSCVLPFIPLPPTTTAPAASIRSPISNGKVQKAVKHTMPQQLLKRRPTELDNNTTSSQRYAIMNLTDFFKRDWNGYHFVDLDELILNMYVFFQSDLPFSK
jgi:hypothetical protein